MNYSVLIGVSISMFKGCPQVIKEGVTPNFKVGKNFCISRVIETSKKISSGEQGTALLKVIITEEELDNMKPGAECELYNGPNKIADCIIITATNPESLNKRNSK